MKYEFISFQNEQAVKDDIAGLFQADIVEKIMLEGKVGDTKNRMRLIQEGQSFKVNESLSPDLYKLFIEVKDALEFQEDIEFFITSSSEINAFALPKMDDSDKHLIIVTSQLIEMLDKEELKFVIGHEIGHLISDYARLSRIIQFIYPKEVNLPMIFRNKIVLWKKLAELTADRFGFIASPKLNKVVSNFFKISSGLSTEKISFNTEEYLQEINQKIDKLKKNPFSNSASHPLNPIRLKALQIFSESELYKKIKENAVLTTDEKLEEQASELYPIITTVADSELEIHRLHFFAAGGLMIASADGEITKEEIEKIVFKISEYYMFPSEFLRSISESDNVPDIFQQSIRNILEINPGEKFNMLSYLVSLALRDREIHPKEIEFIYNTGEKILGITRKETAQIIGLGIQKEFIPKFL